MTQFVRTDNGAYLRLDAIEEIKIEKTGFYVATTTSGRAYTLAANFRPLTDLNIIPQPTREKSES